MQGQNRFSVIIFLVVVLSILHSSKSLKCYETNMINGTITEMECWPNMSNPICFKYKIKFLVNPVRGCASEGFCEIVNNVDEVSKWIEKCHECYTDLCNASTKNMISTTTILTSGLITLFWSIQ